MWYKMDDGSVTRVSISTVLRDAPYILFYTSRSSKVENIPKSLNSESDRKKISLSDTEKERGNQRGEFEWMQRDFQKEQVVAILIVK